MADKFDSQRHNRKKYSKYKTVYYGVLFRFPGKKVKNCQNTDGNNENSGLAEAAVNRIFVQETSVKSNNSK